MKFDIIRNSKNKITMDKINKNLKFICFEISKWLDNLEYSKRISLEKNTCIKLIRDVIKELTTQSKTFTPLVEDILSLIDFNKFRSNSTNMCGICNGCKKEDCGKCKSCKGKYINREYICDKVKCKNINNVPAACLKYDKTAALKGYKNAKMVGDKIFFTEIKIGSINIKQNDFIVKNDKTPVIVRIMYMWYSKMDDELYFHAQTFLNGSSTVLGPFSNRKEIFLTDNCCDKIPLFCIKYKIIVSKVNAKEFCSISSLESDTFSKNISADYFYSKFYDILEGSFTDLPIDQENNEHEYCPSCSRQKTNLMLKIPKIEYSEISIKNGLDITSVEWNNQKYVIGSGVFLEPDILDSYIKKEEKDLKTTFKDEKIYREFYRKLPKNLVGSNHENPLPYCIGIIESIHSVGNICFDSKNINFTVNMFCRPENTTLKNCEIEDLNSIYWLNVQQEVNLTEVVGPVELIYKDIILSKTTLSEWSNSNSDKFYINGAYDVKTQKFIVPPPEVRNIGMKNDFTRSDCLKSKNIKKLRGLEVFSGSGGFTHGILSSDVVDMNWAIEYDTETARSYQINYPECSVIKQEANAFLSKIINNKNKNSNIPKKNEVDFILCSPPCQGFSLLNRFKDTEYSSLQNSLIFTSLSYFDFFRPKYFLIENVRNLATYENGSITQSILRFLLDCGYQCSFAVLQAGNFGVPQNRRRFFIWAAAPGIKLPNFPKPTHCFNHPTSLNVTLNNISTGPSTQFYSAPRRASTIKDAISDLPALNNDESNLHTEYKCNPQSEYQRNMRKKGSFCILDHISKPLSLLNEARVARIPMDPGSDWRDLPNISLKLSNGKGIEVSNIHVFKFLVY